MIADESLCGVHVSDLLFPYRTFHTGFYNSNYCLVFSVVFIYNFFLVLLSLCWLGWSLLGRF